MEGESVFNDATAIVTFQIILAVIATGILDGETMTGGVIDFFVVFFDGLLVGMAFGWVLVQAIPLIGNQPLVHVSLTLVAAYGAFIVADHFLHASGIMAVLSAGLTIGYYGPTLYKQKARQYLEMFWEDAAFVANSLIFLMLGLSEKIFLAHTNSNPKGLLYPVLIAVAVVLVVRFVVVYSLVPALNRLPAARPIDGRYSLILSWGGLRGAVAIALAMSLPKHFPYRWQIIDFAFGVTLFMLLFNGSTMSWLIRRLGLNKPSLAAEYMRVHAEVEAARNAIERLGRIRPVILMSDELREQILAPQREALEKANTRREELRARLAGNPEKRRKLLWVQAFAVQRGSYLKRHADGLLSRRAQQILEWDLKNKHIGVDHEHVVDDQRLPSDRRLGLGVMRLLQQILPGIPPLATWQSRHFQAVTEEATAVIAATRAVRSELSRLAEYSAADPEDVALCEAYYTHLEEMCQGRLDMLAESPEGSIDTTRERMVNHLVLDAKLKTISEFEQTGALPEDQSRTLRDQFEEEHPAEVRPR
jgi:CPA1 family monovalent cation:H+ antiporter